MVTVLRPDAATGVKTCSVVRRDRSAAREFTDKSISLATFHWRWHGLLSAASALDHGCRCREHDERHGSDPQELLRSEIGAHQWNI
jgi:hypothetical protein